MMKDTMMTDQDILIDLGEASAQTQGLGMWLTDETGKQSPHGLNDD